MPSLKLTAGNLCLLMLFSGIILKTSHVMYSTFLYSGFFFAWFCVVRILPGMSF